MPPLAKLTALCVSVLLLVAGCGGDDDGTEDGQDWAAEAEEIVEAGVIPDAIKARDAIVNVLQGAPAAAARTELRQLAESISAHREEVQALEAPQEAAQTVGYLDSNIGALASVVRNASTANLRQRGSDLTEEIASEQESIRGHAAVLSELAP